MCRNQYYITLLDFDFVQDDRLLFMAVVWLNVDGWMSRRQLPTICQLLTVCIRTRCYVPPPTVLPTTITISHHWECCCCCCCFVVVVCPRWWILFVVLASSSAPLRSDYVQYPYDIITHLEHRHLYQYQHVPPILHFVVVVAWFCCGRAHAHYWARTQIRTLLVLLLFAIVIDGEMT